nr:fused MFS/spermidine synthase [Saprospiraceae bacterium]
MKPPLWKKWLSYLFEIHIESNPSKFNPHLYVSLKKGRYQLCTKNAVYSYEDKYDNFKQIFDQLDLRVLEGGKILILGFGLGSIPILLSKKKVKNICITGVEIDENVLYLAHKYALSKISYSMELVVADARDYIELNREEYDLIAVDIFVDDLIPNHFQTEAFLEKCNNSLGSEGVLLYNSLAANQKDKEDSEDFYFNVFTKVFPNAHLVDVRGNYIMVNLKSALIK